MKKLFALFAALLMVFTLASCTGKDAGGAAARKKNDDNGIVKIGFLAFLSGSDNYLGVQPKLAIEDYLLKVNANGGWLGKKVELVTYDVARGIDEFVPAVTRMIEQDGVVAVLGPTNSAGALAAMPVVTQLKVPLVALSATNPRVTVNENTGKVNPYMFRVCFIDPYQAEGLARFIYNSLGYKKIAVLTDVANAYSVGLTEIFVDIFTSLGGRIVRTEGFNENDIEFRAQLVNIGASDAEAIFFPANNIRYGVLVGQQARELGIKLDFVFPDSVYGPELLEGAVELDGSFVSTGLIDDDPSYDEYRRQFQASHNMNANIFAYYGLDAVMAVEAAIKAVNSLKPDDIRDQLERLTNVPVFTGKLTIDPVTHDPLDKPVTIMRIKDGAFKFYEVFDPSAY